MWMIGANPERTVFDKRNLRDFEVVIHFFGFLDDYITDTNIWRISVRDKNLSF